MKFNFTSAGKKANIEGAQLLTGSSSTYVEEKFDGSRFGLELYNGNWHAWSRNNIDRAKNIPYIIDKLEALSLPEGTVLDSEVIVMHPDRLKRWELSRSVMGTKGYNPKTAEAHLLIFDIQYLGQENFKTASYLDRRAVIQDIIKANQTFDTYKSMGRLAYPRAWQIKYLEDLWKQVVEEGNGEGVMLKHNSVAKYGKDWTKVKKEATADAFILGATPGKGKYEGQIGALELAVYNNGVVWPIGKCSGMTDSERIQMTELALHNKLKHKVIEVKFNDVTKNKKLRHPRFVRWRDDKPKEECSIGQL